MIETTTNSGMSLTEFFAAITVLLAAIPLLAWIIGSAIGNKIQKAMLEIHKEFVRQKDCEAIRRDCKECNEAKFQAKK